MSLLPNFTVPPDIKLRKINLMRLLFFFGILFLVFIFAVELDVFKLEVELEGQFPVRQLIVAGEFIFILVFSGVTLFFSIKRLGRSAWMLSDTTKRKLLSYKIALLIGALAFPFGIGCAIVWGSKLASFAQISLLTNWNWLYVHLPVNLPYIGSLIKRLMSADRLVYTLGFGITLFICATVLPFLVALTGFSVVRYLQRDRKKSV